MELLKKEAIFILDLVYRTSSFLWSIFLPFIIVTGLFVIRGTYKIARPLSSKEKESWSLKQNKSSLVISLSSKIGTGAIIGVLAAMKRLSFSGLGGEGIVLWIIAGMFILVPLTYSEVFLSRFSEKPPREFIEEVFNKRMANVYIFSLVTLYSFGFVGFQLTGIQSVLKIFAGSFLQQQLKPDGVLTYIVLPILLGVFVIILTKSHQFFIDVLGSMISLIILLYLLFFIFFLIKTHAFVPKYMALVLEDFLHIKSAAIGLPIGLIIGFQRIIQISETALGTSALACSDGENSPQKEAVLQTLATLFTLFIAVIITSYVFTYGRHMLSEVELTSDGFSRISGYLTTVKAVTGMLGLIVVIAFFIVSGFTTILGSFHFLNTSLCCSENMRIGFYMLLITASGLLSVSNFDIIFDIADLLMFVVGSIMILAMAAFIRKEQASTCLGVKKNIQ